MPDENPDKNSLNPGDLRAAERDGTLGGNIGKKPDEDSDDLRTAAESAESEGGWKDGVTGAVAATAGKMTIGKVAKTNSPTALVLLLLFFGGVGMGGLFGGAGLLLNLKEILSTNIMDAVPTMNEIRARSLLAYKLNSKATAGVCTPISIRCKFQTMNDRQIAKLEKAGIKVNTDGGKGALSRRTKVTSFEFTDPKTKITKTITANNLIKEMRATPAFASALQKGYNSRFGAWSSSAFENLTKRISLNMRKNLSGSPDVEESAKELRENASGAKAQQISVSSKPVYGDPDNPSKITGYVDGITGAPISVEEYEGKVSAASTPEAKAIFDQKKSLADVGSNGLKVTGAALKGSLLVGTGLVDSGCTGWTIVRAAGFAAKYLGALQLIRYANTFLNTADAIKAGDATPEEVEYLANIIISENSAGVSGTNSRGFNYAAYGDVSAVPAIGEAASASATPSGNGVTITDDAAQQEELNTEVTNYINGQITSDTIMAKLAEAAGQGGAATDVVDDACGFIKSGPGQAVIIGVGVAALAACVLVNVLPILGQVASGSCLGANAAVSAGISITIAVALNILTPQLIAAATDSIITGNENGNEAVNAVVSGAGAMNAQNGFASGLGSLGKEDATYFKQQSEEIKSDFAAIDQYDYSPLDPTNGNTFMGKFVSAIAPAAAKMSTISGGLTSISSLLSTSFASIIPSTHAKSYGDAGVCKDPDYTDDATDINCNLLVGQTKATQEIPIDTQLDYMINGGHIDEISGTAKSSQLKDFIKYCPERTMAFGAIEEGASVDLRLMRGEYCRDGGGGGEMYDMFRAYNSTFLVAEGMDDDVAASAADNEGLVSPVSDGFSITSTFGPRSCDGCSTWHQGIDLLSSDKEVKAAMAGEVISIDDPGGNNAVNILHKNGLITTYMHMYSKDILVKAGDTVTAGQKLGVMGNSGDSKGTHLHFEVNISRVENQLTYTSKYIVNDGGWAPGTRIDPKDFMAKNGIAGF